MITAPRPWLGIETRDWFINSDTPQPHGGFGERPGKTDQQQCRHRAPGRLHRHSGRLCVPVGAHLAYFAAAVLSP